MVIIFCLLGIREKRMGTAALVSFTTRGKEALILLKMLYQIILPFLFKSFFAFIFSTPFVSFPSKLLKSKRLVKELILGKTDVPFFFCSNPNFNTFDLMILRNKFHTLEYNFHIF